MEDLSGLYTLGLALLCLAASPFVLLAFFIYRAWRKHQRPQPPQT